MFDQSLIDLIIAIISAIMGYIGGRKLPKSGAKTNGAKRK